jgi:LysM repeat protein
MGFIETATSLQRIIRSRLRLAEFSLSREEKRLLGIVAIGAVLRLYLLGSKSIWLDEAFSIAMGQRGLIDLLHKVVLTDTHPPLYYLLLKFWMVFSAEEASVRLLSALFSIAAIPVMYAVVARLYTDKKIGLVGATILAFSPFQVWYAQEARMYAMLTFLVLLSAHFFLKALQAGERRDWIGYVIATTLALYTDNGAIWYVVTISIFYLVSIKRFPGKPIDWFLSNAAICLLYIPWFPFFLEQTRQVTGSFWLPAPTFSTLLATFLDFHSLNFPLAELSLLYMAAIFVWVTIVPAGDWQRRLSSMWLFIPVATSLFLSLRQPIFLSRNLIAASLGYYLLIAGIIWRFRSKRAMLALLLPLVAMNLVSIGYNAWWEPKEDWRAVASYVARSTQKRPAGMLVFIPGYTELPFNYYFKDYDIPIVTQGYPGDEILLHPEPNQVEDIGKVLEGRPYIWLIVRDIESAGPNWTVKTWLDTHGYVRQKDFVQESISVLTYIRWDKAPQSSDPNTLNDIETSTKSYIPFIQLGRDLETYRVKPEETLLEIAVRFETTVQLLMEINHLKNPNEIIAGQELQVPVVKGGTPYP